MPQRCDVLIAGLGPVGQLLANLLGARGLSVVAVDPADGPAGQPRAATTDDEVLRILQGVGLAGALAPHLAVQPKVSFVAADGRRMTLLETGPGASGHPSLAAWHQPAVERVLTAGLLRFASVQARFGVGVEALEPEPSRIRVRLSDAASVEAAWVVGCDGARSAVRRLSAIGFDGSTSAQPWVVVDTLVDHPPAGLDHVHFIGDPRRPAVTLPMAPDRHRWEFQCSRAEADALLASPGRVAALVEGRVERRAVYEFHARTAASWRSGRVLLAGDAAHLMPPFGGQGLAAGARDAANLAWKLAAVVGGAPPRLLDTYEEERRPAVRMATRVALAWGAVLQTRRPRLARARDHVMFAVGPTPLGTWLRRRARPRPRLRRGVLWRPRRPGTGVLFPQPSVRVQGRRARLDDVLGDGWAVLGELSSRETAAWRSIGARVPEGVEDADRAIAVWLDRHRATWVALRPDRYVFAVGRPGEAVRAAAAAAAWLG